MKLYSYVIKTVFLAMLAGVFGLWLLQLVFAYLNELEYIKDGYSYQQALYFVLYKSPQFWVQFMPTGILLGAVIGLGTLASSSELVVMRSFGISIIKIIMMVMTPAVLFALVALYLNQFVIPHTNQQASQIGQPTAPIVALHGYWATQSDNGTTHIINIDYADNLGNLKNIKQYSLQDNQLTQAFHAKTGTTTDNPYIWQLQDIQKITIGTQYAIGTQYIKSQNQASERLVLPIDKSSIHLLTKSYDNLSISELYDHYALMKHQNSRSIRHELIFWQKLLGVFSVLSLVLVACSFVFGSLRSQGLGARVVLALLTGLVFSYVQDLSGFIAIAYGLSPFLMACLPIVLSGSVGMYLIAKKR